MAKEFIGAKGTVFLQVWNAKGDLIEEITQENLIVNVGKQALAYLLGSANSNKKVVEIGFGTSGVGAAGADTYLTNNYQKALDGVTYSGTSVVFAYSLGLSENNGITIREFGLFTDDDTLFSRITRNAINKTSDIRLTGTWTITF